MKPMVSLEIVSSGIQVTTERGSRLVEVLAKQHLLLRSDCGGKGRCGKCRVELIEENNDAEVPGCLLTIDRDMKVRVPASSLLSMQILDKPPLQFPVSFAVKGQDVSVAQANLGVAVDLGTTTIALYLCDLGTWSVLGSVALKNPQAIYGDDVMSRIARILQQPTELKSLQILVVEALSSGMGVLLDKVGKPGASLTQMMVVGNPTMVQILLGMDPSSIGMAPYLPQFYEGQNLAATEIDLAPAAMVVKTFPQLSGFLGGDILAAVIGTDLPQQPAGSLLIDLGTNGELVLLGKGTIVATSCATGPAFEGATISCGVQAIPGAIDRIWWNTEAGIFEWSCIGQSDTPIGICGSGLISGVSAMLQAGMLLPDGKIVPRPEDPPGCIRIVRETATPDGREIVISQKDIRSVQLGKAALAAGIERLLQVAGLTRPEKVFVAGGFGTYLHAEDMLQLGMIPQLPVDRIHFMGNSAGAGAVMALCEQDYLGKIAEFVEAIEVIELAVDPSFQQSFIHHLHFRNGSS